MGRTLVENDWIDKAITTIRKCGMVHNNGITSQQLTSYPQNVIRRYIVTIFNSWCKAWKAAHQPEELKALQARINRHTQRKREVRIYQHSFAWSILTMLQPRNEMLAPMPDNPSRNSSTASSTGSSSSSTNLQTRATRKKSVGVGRLGFGLLDLQPIEHPG